MAAHRAQADALEIEDGAKRRLADEYDAAQERGEVGQRTGRPTKDVLKQNDITTAADVGLSRKDVHEVRAIRDAEKRDPGIDRRTLDDAIRSGKEPTKARVKRATTKATKRMMSKRKPHCLRKRSRQRKIRSGCSPARR